MLTNVPMLLTLFRIAAIPGIVALLFMDTNLGRYLACTLFGIAAITDFFDGYLARALSQQSKMGQFLDPVADIHRKFRDSPVHFGTHRHLFGRTDLTGHADGKGDATWLDRSGLFALFRTAATG